MNILIYIVLLLIGIEFFATLLVTIARNKSFLVLTKKDENPVLDKNGLQKFFSHGYDKDLGWIRKPSTQKTEQGKTGKTTYSINKDGARSNPGHEHLPVKCICVGDSFTFARQVNDDETWSWYLSKYTHSNVINFGVGNYGADQAFLRYKKEKMNAPVVILGVVPSTILRILCMWKHYHDFGNVFGFKPRFTVEGDLLKNPIDDEEKFFSYEKYLPFIQKNDYYYPHFKRHVLTFPYSFSLLKKPHMIPRVFLSLCTLGERRKARLPLFIQKVVDKRAQFSLPHVKLFAESYPTTLLKKILLQFSEEVREAGSKPVLLWMPQKEDIIYMKKKGIFYEDFLKKLPLEVIDLTSIFMEYKELDNLYTDDSKYGGHLSPEGNKIVAKELLHFLPELLEDD